MNIFNDPQALQQMQSMGINPYQFQAFLQSPQGMQVQQECNQYVMSKFGEYVNSISQNFGQMGKSSGTDEVQNNEYNERLTKTENTLEEIKELLISQQKGAKNGNK